MAHWQLGEQDEARRWYDLAVDWMEKNKEQLDEKPQTKQTSAASGRRRRNC